MQTLKHLKNPVNRGMNSTAQSLPSLKDIKVEALAELHARVAECEAHGEHDSLQKEGLGLRAARSCGAAQAKLDGKLAEAVDALG